MNTVLNLFRNIWNLLACIGELLGYLLRFISVFFQPRASLAASLVAAESQLSVCKRRVEQKGFPRFRFTTGFRLLWVVLPSPSPSLHGHIWPKTIKLQLRNLPTLLANAGPKWAVCFVHRSRWSFSGGHLL